MGLLDFMNTDEGMQGLGLLAAAAPSMAPMNLAGRLAQAGASYRGMQDNKLKEEFIRSQIADHLSQSEARKLAGIKDARMQKMQEAFMYGDGNQNAVSPGAFSPSTDGMGPVMPMSAPQAQQGVQGGALAYARSIGIPEKAIQADMTFNGGKGIAEMMFKRGTPNMKVANGFAYDENKLGTGFMPGINTSASGQTSMTRIGANGLPVISAPEGAVDTFGAYKGIETGLGAAAKVNLRKNPDGTETPVSELAENPTLQNMLTGGRPSAPAGYATEPQMKVTAGGPMGADPAALQREIKATQNSMLQGNLDGPSRTALREHLADLNRQAANIGATRTASGAPSYGMTNDQAATADASKATLVDTAKAGVVRDTSQIKEGKLYGQLTAGLDRAITLLEQGPTASGAGRLYDSAAGFFGQSTKGADTASQLDTISGWLTSNVPRMEGPQSDRDVQQYRIMAAEVGDRSKPVSQRLAAAKELQGLQAKYAELNGGKASSGGSSGQWGDKPMTQGTAFDSKPPAHNFKGKTATGPDGKRYKSDGLIWKEVQ